MSKGELESQPLKFGRDNYEHPKYKLKKVAIEIEIDEEKLGNIIKDLNPHDIVTHIANIPPSAYSVSQVRLLPSS